MNGKTVRCGGKYGLTRCSRGLEDKEKSCGGLG